MMRSLQTPYSLCDFGIARADITPPVGIYHRMWGAASHERATGIHSPLTATAMAFRPHTVQQEVASELILIAVDHCLLWAPEMDELLRAISRQSDVPVERIVVTFSHTHAAGLMDRRRVHLPGGELIEPYLESLAAKLTSLVSEARRSSQPAVCTYGEGQCSLATNRDGWDEHSGQYVCGFNPDAAADDTLLVVRVTSEDGTPLASLVNYACHPTTLAWENTRISSDFPGAMQELIENATHVPCAFLQGASGDLGPRVGFVKQEAAADSNGYQLGYAALAALEALPPPATEFRYAGPVLSGATLGIWQHVPLAPRALERKSSWRCRRWTVDLPYRCDLPNLEQTRADRSRWHQEAEAAAQLGESDRARDCRALVERLDRQLTRLAHLPPGPTFPLPVTLWQMGDAYWVAVECEHYNLLQRALRERFVGVPIVVITLANGSRASYLPTRETYGKGIYQETIAVLAAGCLEQLIDAIGDAIAAWLKEYRDAT